VEEDRIADEVALVVHRDELLGPVDSEVLEAVHACVAQEAERVGSGDEQVGHVVRLIEEGHRIPPRELLGPPIRELGGHREDGRARLGVAQQLDRAPDPGDGVGDGLGHGNSFVRGRDARHPGPIVVMRVYRAVDHA